MLSPQEQSELKSLQRDNKAWGLSGYAKQRFDMLVAKQGSAAQGMKQGKTKFLATAEIDRQMGDVLLDALKPEGVEVRHLDSDRGTTAMWRSNYNQASSVAVSNKARWEDLQVASRRTKNAPVLPVIESLLPAEMTDVWLGLESAHSAYKQAEWTHNPKIVDEQKRWLQRTNQTSLQGLVQRSSLGIPATDAMQTMRKASEIQWLVEHSSELQDAVKAADDMESLVEVAMWVGEELGLIQDDQQDDSPPPEGCIPTPPDRDNKPDRDSDGGDKSGGDDDSDDSDDASDSDDSDDASDSDDSDSKSGDSNGGNDGSEDKSGQDKPQSLADKVKEAVAEAMDEQDNAPVQQDGLFDLNPTEDEDVKVIDSNLVPKRLIQLDTAAKPVETEFELLEDEQDDYFGDPQGDILHDIRLGILDVFEQETPSDPQLIIAVDNSISMQCNCRKAGRRSLDGNPDAGYLAWQVAGILGKQFPDSKIFGWTTSSSSSRSAPIVFDMPAGYRPACRSHESNHHYQGNTPEAEALLYAQSQLESNENSVLVVITDGEPNNKPRSYGITHAMHKAGTKFAVVTVGDYQPALADLHYPPATVLSIKSAVELSKVSKIFDLIRK